MAADGSVIINVLVDDDKAAQDIKKLFGTIKKETVTMDKVGDSFTKIGKSLTKTVTAPLVAAGIAAGKFAIDYETAFAGIRKTTDATEEEYAALSAGIREMATEIPASAAAIAEVGEAAGQLGIKKENLLDFSRVMIDLGNSTNLSATEGAKQLARFANIVGMSQNDFDKLGSTIVDLGNNFATTEAEIVDMGMRLAGAGKQVGLTEPQIMGLATTLSSLGLESEAGGTAFSKLMRKMAVAVETGGKGLEDFAAVAGVATEDFQKAFREDAMGAITLFLEGLNAMSEDGESAIKILDNMEIRESRLTDAILRTSGATDVLNSAMELGTVAWGENTALSEEATKRYETMESKLAILKNTVMDVAMQLGESLMPYLQQGIDVVKKLVKRFGDMDDASKKNIIRYAATAAAIGPVILSVGKLLKGVSAVSKVFQMMPAILRSTGAGMGIVGGALGILIASNENFRNTAIKAIRPVLDAFKSLFNFIAQNGQAILSLLVGIGTAIAIYSTVNAVTVAMQGLGTAIDLAAKAQAVLNAVMNANHYALAATALAGLVAFSIAFAASQETMADKVKESYEGFVGWSEGLDEVKASISDLSEYSLENGETMASLSQTIQEHEDAITETIRTANSENRGLRDDEIADIKEHQEEIKKLQGEQLKIASIQQAAVTEMIKADGEAGRISAETTKEHIANIKQAEEDQTTFVRGQFKEQLADIMNNTTLTDAERSKQTEGLRRWYDEQQGLIEGKSNEQYALLQGYTAQIMENGEVTFREHGKIVKQTVETDTEVFEGLKKNIDDYVGKKGWSLEEEERLANEHVAKLREKALEDSSIYEGMGLSLEEYLATEKHNYVAAGLAYYDWSEEHREAAQGIADTMASLKDTSGNAILSIAEEIKSNGGEVTDETKGVAKTILSSFKNLPDDLQESGANALRGLAGGLKDEIPGLENMSEMSADEIVETIEKALDIHSPSRVMRDRVGKPVVQGISEGIKGETPNLISTSKNTADQVVRETENALNRQKNTLSNAGSSLGSGVASGISKGVKNGQFSLGSTIKGVVNSAISAAKRVLGIHSPSRVTAKEIGSPLMQGVGVGMKKELSNLLTISNATVASLGAEMRSAALSAGPTPQPTGNSYAASNSTVSNVDNRQTLNFYKETASPAAVARAAYLSSLVRK